MPARFNSPPGWPVPPKGWEPSSGWRPDPTWAPAPPGWQFWIDDAEARPFAAAEPRAGSNHFAGHDNFSGPGAASGADPFALPTASQRHATAGQGAARSLAPAEICGWGGLAATVVIALLTGGISSGMIFLGLYAGVVGIVALVRGQVGWARLGDRRAAGAVTAVAVLVLIVGSATAPASVSDANSVAADADLGGTVSQSSPASPTGSAKSSGATVAPLIDTSKAKSPSARPAPKAATAKSRLVVKPKPKPVTRKPKPVQTTSKSRCDPNYSGGCVPIASDVDCAGGSGNGPAYFSGVAKVVGTDIYRLDSDGDGYACEKG